MDGTLQFWSPWQASRSAFRFPLLGNSALNFCPFWEAFPVDRGCMIVLDPCWPHDPLPNPNCLLGNWPAIIFPSTVRSTSCQDVNSPAGYYVVGTPSRASGPSGSRRRQQSFHGSTQETSRLRSSCGPAYSRAPVNSRAPNVSNSDLVSTPKITGSLYDPPRVSPVDLNQLPTSIMYFVDVFSKTKRPRPN